MEHTKPVLETKDLTFKDILSYPDLRINEGEIVFIEGASGSGKSSLLKLFNYTYTPTEGEVLYRGKPTSRLDTVELRKKVLLVSQSVFLFDGTVRENFDLFYDYRNQPHLSDSEKEHYLDLARAPFGLGAPCQNMSGGERQRVYLAVCLSFRPDVLMLDEPTSALDNPTSRELFENLSRFVQENGMTLVVISHNRTLSKEFAQKIIEVERGVSHAGNR